MIPKPDFGDHHRFRVSLSIVLMAAGPIVVWLTLRESYDLFRTTEEIDGLTPWSRWIVYFRQCMSIVITILSIVVAVWLFTIGLDMFKIGDAKWQRMQDLHDEILELDRDAKKAGFRQLSAAEIIQSEIEEARIIKSSDDEAKSKGSHHQDDENIIQDKIGDEVNEDGGLESITTESESDGSASSKATSDVSDSDSVEVRVWFNRQRIGIFTSKVMEWAGGRYLVLTELGVRGLKYDLVLRSVDNTQPDILVEVKNYAAMDGYNATLRSVFDYSVMNQIYESSINRKSRTIYFLTTKSRELIHQLAHRLNDQNQPNANRLNSVVVVLMTERQFSSLQPYHLDYVMERSWGVVVWDPQSMKTRGQISPKA